MKIVVTGGGSGGHITPILAVVHELKIQQSDLDITYIGQKGDGLADIPAQDKNIDHVKLVHAGKFRRYHGEGLKQLLDIPTMLKNLRDAFLVLSGIWECFWLLRTLKPGVIFIKGGFVGVPVGLAAAVLRIPYVTHDSDALPGLANRIIAPWAKLHAVGLPEEVYNYPKEKTVTTGVPVSVKYHPFSKTERAEALEHITGNPKGRLILVTGGGNGAKRINEAVAVNAAALLTRYPDLTIVQVAGRSQEAAMRQYFKQELPANLQKRVIVKGFVTNMYTYIGASDVVIMRAGATSIAECAAQQKACIVIPNPLLAGGHQLKNAEVLAERAAVKLLPESRLRQDTGALMPPLVDLLDNPDRAKRLGKTLGLLTEPDAAKRLAVLLLEQAA